MVDGETRTAVREVTWAFEYEGEMQVGLYAARPTKAEDDHGDILVQFETLRIRVKIVVPNKLKANKRLYNKLKFQRVFRICP